jgi:signal peptidase II
MEEEQSFASRGAVVTAVGDMPDRVPARGATFWTIVALAAAIVGLDQATKWWILERFALHESRPVTSYFSLTLVHNTGTAFGLFQDNNQALTVLAFLILAGLLYAARGISERGGWWGSVGVAFVLGGAVGNIIDRFRFGRVIDFLDFHFWPVFNVADSAITVGAVAIAFALWTVKEPR